MMKLMPDILVPMSDVRVVATQVFQLTEAQIAKLGSNRCVKLLQHTLKFAEHQFGKRIEQHTKERKAIYKRNNGDWIGSWNVEVIRFVNIYDQLSLRNLENAIPYMQKVLALLGPWRIQIDLSENERTDELDEEKIDTLHVILSATAYKLGKSYLRLYLLFFYKKKIGRGFLTAPAYLTAPA
jgi:hypothetical protein